MVKALGIPFRQDYTMVGLYSGKGNTISIIMNTSLMQKIITLVKENENYKLLLSDTSQQILRMVDETLRAFWDC